jgi:hypothetical protein
MMRRLVVAYRHHRFAVLFYSLLATLAASPVLAAFDVDRNWVWLLLDLNLFTAVFGVTSGRHGLAHGADLALRLGLAWVIAARLLMLFVNAHPLSVTTRPLAIAIGFGTVAAALSFALRAPRVDTEHVYAALSAYLLAGVFAGMLHLEVERVWPGSYTSGNAVIPGFNFTTAIYFSFVTLATLGYGDIVPRSDVARGVTVVEAVAGQLYLAVLIARLISMNARPIDAGSGV